MPGFAEVVLVSHSGNPGSGKFACLLNLTDVHTGWTATRAILGKGLEPVLDALEEIRAALPFPLRGINSDNGSARTEGAQLNEGGRGHNPANRGHFQMR
jgi:hypothetical protein